MGAAYLGRNVAALATNGRTVTIGMQGGTKGELDLGVLLAKRGSVHATLTARPARRGESVHRRRGTRATCGPYVESGQVRVVVDRTLPLEAGRGGTSGARDGRGITGKCYSLHARWGRPSSARRRA